MILEGIVTTVGPDGVNIAPMGPRLPSADTRTPLAGFELRPFRTSRTYANLKAHPEGVLHVSDDVLLLARSAIGIVEPLPALRPAEGVRGWVLVDACRAYEFRIVASDESDQRIRLQAEVVHRHWLRDFFGFNRAKHAVLEAAILATRTDFLPLDEIEAEYRRLAVLVQKTGGEDEHAAFALLQRHVEAARGSANRG
jgi:hypothetical protein